MDIETKKLIENIKIEIELKKKLKEISKPILIKSVNREKDKSKRKLLSEMNRDNYLDSKKYFYKELKY
ncbi:MAG: hypothetical protein ACO25K_04910 [Candidatus Fonsibacter ubiquis]